MTSQYHWQYNVLALDAIRQQTTSLICVEAKVWIGVGTSIIVFAHIHCRCVTRCSMDKDGACLYIVTTACGF